MLNHPSEIRIAIADDQHLFRQSLELLIGSEPAFQLIASAENGADLLQQISHRDPLPDVALIDLNMPGIDGVELNAILQEKYPAIKVIVLTIYFRNVFISRVIRDGAAGYLLKNCDKNELINAIHTVVKTGFYLNQLALQAIRKASTEKPNMIRNFNNIPIELTPREKEVLLLICQEYSSTEIAQKLFLSARTVEGHRNNLIAKVGCRNTAGLVVFAVKYDLLQVSF
jgi:DNA-binding NarL/FixJ family response regulator